MQLDRAEGFSAWSSPAPIWLKEAPSTRGALDRFFPQAPCSLFANDLVGDIDSTYGSPSRGLASRGPASPGEQDHLEPLPLNSWVCTTHHHHPETTQPQKGYPFKETSYWRDSNSACESWPYQSLSRLLTEVPTLIIKSVASSCASWRRFSTMFLCSRNVKEPQ